MEQRDLPVICARKSRKKEKNIIQNIKERKAVYAGAPTGRRVGDNFDVFKLIS